MIDQIIDALPDKVVRNEWANRNGLKERTGIKCNMLEKYLQGMPLQGQIFVKMYKSNHRRRIGDVYSLLGFIGRKFPTIKEGLFDHQQAISEASARYHLHVIGVPTDCEGKTAANFRVVGFQVGVLQGAARQHRFLRVVECNGAKLLPITNEVVLDDNLVDS